MTAEQHDATGVYTVKSLHELEQAYEEWKEAEHLANDAMYPADLPEEGFPMVVAFERHELTTDTCNILEYL